MNTVLLKRIARDWADQINGQLDELDASMRGERGPKGGVPLRALLMTMVHLMVDQRPAYLKAAWQLMCNATPQQRELLGISKVPTYRQLCLLVERIHRHFGRGDPLRRSERIQKLLDLIVPASAGPVKGTRTWAVDTTLFDAWARYVKNGASSDRDASWRVLNTPDRIPKMHFGYAAVAVVRADGDGPEVCDRLAVMSADQDDAIPAQELCVSMQQDGAPIERVLADRGFSQKPDRFQVPLRKAGIFVTHDLKKDDIGYTGTFNGAHVIDGWLFSPGMPKRLRRIVRPGLNAPMMERVKFRKLIEERMQWAFLPHAAPQPHRARVASPVRRNNIKCDSTPGQQNAPASAPTCHKKHAADKACGINTMAYEDTVAPRTYQWPVWGTREWQRIYNKRSAVERYFGHLQSDATAGFRRGRFRLRGMAKVGLITGLSVVATNLMLRQSSVSAGSAAGTAASSQVAQMSKAS
jgi:hypothetical protein